MVNLRYAHGHEAIWAPDPDRLASAAITRFASRRDGRDHQGYGDLRAWSVEHLEEFWAAVWDFFEIAADGDPSTVLADAGLPGARWFPGTRLNYAEHALRSCAVPRRAHEVAVTEIREDRHLHPHDVGATGPCGRARCDDREHGVCCRARGCCWCRCWWCWCGGCGGASAAVRAAGRAGAGDGGVGGGGQRQVGAAAVLDRAGGPGGADRVGNGRAG
jgi:hypothetical protein